MPPVVLQEAIVFFTVMTGIICSHHSTKMCTQVQEAYAH